MRSIRRNFSGFGPVLYPVHRNQEHRIAPLVIAQLRDVVRNELPRNKTRLRHLRKEKWVPAIVQPERPGEKQLLVSVPVSRLVTLRKKGLFRLNDDKCLLQLDVEGKLLAVTPKLVAEHPVSGLPVSVVFNRAPLTAEDIAKQSAEMQASVKLPDPIMPLGWHYKNEKKD